MAFQDHIPRLFSASFVSGAHCQVADLDIKNKYEEHILQHSGVRLIEPELFHGYDPNNKVFFQGISIDQEMKPIEVSKDEALAFRRQHGEACEVPCNYANAPMRLRHQTHPMNSVLVRALGTGGSPGPGPLRRPPPPLEIGTKVPDHRRQRRRKQNFPDVAKG